MNFSIAFPKSIETLSLSAGHEGEDGRKSVGVKGVDGFAELLNVLAMVTPGTLIGEDRQSSTLPAGKILPLSPAALPVDAIEGSGTASAELVAQIGLPAVAASGVEPDTLKSVSGLSPDNPNGASARPTLREIVLNASSVARANTAAASEPTPNGENQAVRGLQINISAATEPQDRHATVASSAPSTPLSAKPETISAATNQSPIQAVAAAANADRKPGKDQSGTEKHAAGAIAANSQDTGKLIGNGTAMPFEEAFNAARPAAAAARPVVADPFANVERVVEHLMAARQIDLTKPAAISVAHREFGSLTVTFDQSEKGVNVEIAAENRDAQRALAAAMASERGSSRQQDSGALNFSTVNQPASANAERGGSTGNSGAAPGQSGSGHEHRSQNSEQRSRQGDGAPSNRQSPAPKSGDEALYA